MPTIRLIDAGIEPELSDEIAPLVSDDLDLITEVTPDLICGPVRRYEQIDGPPALPDRALPGTTRWPFVTSIGVRRPAAYGDGIVLIHASHQDARQTTWRKRGRRRLCPRGRSTSSCGSSSAGSLASCAATGFD